MKIEDIQEGKEYYGHFGSHTNTVKVERIFKGVNDYIDGTSKRTGVMYASTTDYCKCGKGGVPEQWELEHLADWALEEVSALGYLDWINKLIQKASGIPKEYFGKR